MFSAPGITPRCLIPGPAETSSIRAEAGAAGLPIRAMDSALRAQLKARARAHHRSVEEEARETLRAALARRAVTSLPMSLLGVAGVIFGPERGVDVDLPSHGADARGLPPDFSGDAYGR